MEVINTLKKEPLRLKDLTIGDVFHLIRTPEAILKVVGHGSLSSGLYVQVQFVHDWNLRSESELITYRFTEDLYAEVVRLRRVAVTYEEVN